MQIFFTVFSAQSCHKLEKNLIFYRGYDDSQAASTFHRIDKNGELGAGKNLDLDDLEELFRGNGKCAMNFLPPNILAVKNNSIVWYEKSRKHPIYFRPTENKRQRLGKYSGREIIWPPLLFMVSRGGLYCRAPKSNRRPTLQTLLFQAPLTHIDEDSGLVCTPTGLTLRHGASPFEHMKSVAEQFYEVIFGHEEKTKTVMEKYQLDVQEIHGLMNPRYRFEKPGYPEWALQNNNSEIGRLKKRIKEVLRYQQDAAALEESGELPELVFDGAVSWTTYRKTVCRYSSMQNRMPKPGPN